MYKVYLRICHVEWPFNSNENPMYCLPWQIDICNCKDSFFIAYWPFKGKIFLSYFMNSVLWCLLRISSVSQRHASVLLAPLCLTPSVILKMRWSAAFDVKSFDLTHKTLLNRQNPTQFSAERKMANTKVRLFQKVIVMWWFDFNSAL